ncbi:MAG: magnesium transporter [Candidatus Enteromonas sp.]|nr:magnesium transporter [Candidatus Enteromonas sp.]
MEDENKGRDEEIEEEETDDSGIDVETTSAEELSSLIDRKDRVGLGLVFETVPNIDIAEAANSLSPEQLIYIFHNVSSEYTADFFDDLSLETKENLIKAMTDKDLVKIINAQSADDLADAVGDMPANLAYKVLMAADKDMRKDINTLLKYKDDTAGSIMTTEYINLLDSTSVAEAISYIRERGKDAETIYTIFVRNASREFVGTVDLDDLIFAQPSETLNDIMNRDIVSVKTSTDQEEVGRMFSRYDLNALAVLNEDDRIVGVITIDDAIDVIAEETNEDMARMALMEPAEKPYMQTSIWDNAKHCIPWIIALLVLGTFTTMVLNRLEAQTIFVSLPILISFIPTLMDTGGNAGGQTTGMMIRGLATREFSAKDTLKVLWKEFRSAIVIGFFIALFSFVWILIEQYTGIVSLGEIVENNGNAYDFSSYTVWNGLAFTGEHAKEFAQHAFTFSGLVSATMFIAISLSKGIGTLLCMGASAIKKDPALLAQPMLTTIMDVTSLLVYFGMACLFFPKLI